MSEILFIDLNSIKIILRLVGVLSSIFSLYFSLFSERSGDLKMEKEFLLAEPRWLLGLCGNEMKRNTKEHGHNFLTQTQQQVDYQCT
jgi:hypothetical protein